MAGATVTVTGLEDLTRRMKRYGVEGRKAMDRALRKGAEETRTEALKGIQRGPHSGRIYPPISGVRGSPHQSSAPGQYPATDTGRLVSSVKVVQSRGDYLIGTSLDYGRWLEFGTSRVEPRPWLRPSMKAVIPRLRKYMIAELGRLSRGR